MKKYKKKKVGAPLKWGETTVLKQLRIPEGLWTEIVNESVIEGVEPIDIVVLSLAKKLGYKLKNK